MTDPGYEHPEDVTERTVEIPVVVDDAVVDYGPVTDSRGGDISGGLTPTWVGEAPESCRGNDGDPHDRSPLPGRPTSGPPVKSTMVRAAAAATLLVVTTGGATAIAMDKTITITVDDEQRQVHTFAGTVDGALDSAGLSAGAKDALAPAAHASIIDGSRIVLKRGRKLMLTVDGRKREVWTTALTVDEAMRHLGMRHDGALLSADRHQRIPLEGMALDLKTAKLITLLDGGQQPREVATNATSVEDLLREQNVALEQDDTVKPEPKTPLTGEKMTVEVTRSRFTEVVEKVKIDPPEEKQEDSSMNKGEKEVIEEGEPGEKEVTFKVITVNGKRTEKKELRSKVLKEPKPRKIKVGTKPIADAAVWDRLAQCEATGNWSIVSANGKYHGGLQFDRQTWQAYGGGAYAPVASQASREQQIAIATKVRDRRGGYSAWPHCSAKLGLR
ncbi:resuscitation-promoting factor [Allokutzneria multivorans]|uniref:Resuscitation-promoting factor n=1 Tax=Allokutzneria multivorans TaxID=1142134 RepID=A0ABP7RN86_9PSEU